MESTKDGYLASNWMILTYVGLNPRIHRNGESKGLYFAWLLCIILLNVLGAIQSMLAFVFATDTTFSERFVVMIYGGKSLMFCILLNSVGRNFINPKR